MVAGWGEKFCGYCCWGRDNFSDRIYGEERLAWIIFIWGEKVFV